MRRYFDSSIDAPFSYSIAHGLQGIVPAFFHRIFALAVNNDGALLGLFFAVAANFYQRLYYPVKCIHIVIPYNEAAIFVFQSEKISFCFGFCRCICFHNNREIQK